MNIYKLTRKTSSDYDEYDSCVVVSDRRDKSLLIHPGNCLTNTYTWNGENWIDSFGRYSFSHGWTDPKNIDSEYVGKAYEELQEGTILCSSFNAG